MKEIDDAPASSISESRPEKRIHAIDGQIQIAYGSLLDSFCEIGLVEDRGMSSFFLDGRRYKISDEFRRENVVGADYSWVYDRPNVCASKLPFPLNIPGSFLSLEPLSGHNAISIGCPEGELNHTIEILSKDFGSSSKLLISKMPDSCSYFESYVEGMRRFEYYRGEIDLTEYETAEQERYVRDGGGFRLARIIIAKGKPSFRYPLRPTVEEFQVTEEWQWVQEIQASARQAAEKRRIQPSGHMHIPHPHRPAGVHIHH